MSNNNVINEKKKALLAYKEKILEEIKYYERSIDDFRANHKNNSFYDDHDSSDSEDDFPSAIDTGPTIPQLKLQQAMMKTCLHATQELTSLTVLQSEVTVLVEDPKFEGERPVTESGTWREVTAECRIDLVPFTITFFMHTPNRKFGPTSYRGLRVVPVKYPHEMELAKSVLHSLKLPSDAVEVLRNYAVGYRSRRTTLARLANKYANALFMEPHAEGGVVLKCADLLELSWRLENKWSPVAPFHHKMKFDLEYMDETYIKIITQAHKQLLDPSIATDERTLLLAKIIATCLEARGPVDPESDLESKTTERDTDNEKRDRDSEVMAPPKSLPKKVKQKNKDSVTNTAQKRSLDDENGDEGAKKMKSDVLDDESRKNDDKTSNNARKSKLNDVVTEGSKKRKINEVSDKVNKVASGKNVKDSGNTEDGDNKPKNDDTGTANIKPKINKEAIAKSNNKGVNKDDIANKDINNKKPKVTKDSVNTEVKNNNKNKDNNVKGDGDAAIKDTNTKSKNTKDTEKNINAKAKNNVENLDSEAKDTNKVINTKPKTKIAKEPTNAVTNTKSKTKLPKDTPVNLDKENNANNVKESNNLDKNVKTITKIAKETINKEKTSGIKTKNTTSKSSGVIEDKNSNENAKNKNIERKKPKNIAKVNSKENIDTNKLAKNIDSQTKSTEKNTKVADTKNSEATMNKAKTKSVANTKTDKPTMKLKTVNKAVTEKTTKTKTVNSNETQTIKKVTAKNATNIKNNDKISQIVPEKNIRDKLTPTTKDGASDKVLNSNLVTKKTKEILNKDIIKKPIKTIKNITHQIASHRNASKVQNPQKIKAGNTNMFKAGNTEKENGGKITKIPLKKMSPISEGSSKKNLLRISPRKTMSKFKTSTSFERESFKQKMVKSTNIPRLLKKPAAKTTSILTIK